MSSFSRNFGLFIGSSIALLQAHLFGAALQWESTLLKINVNRGVDSVAATFAFKNLTSEEIPFPEITTSCDCISLARSSDRILPHGVGAITALVRVGTTDVPFEQRIHVQSGENLYGLKLIISPVIWFKFTPAIVYWSKSDLAEPKFIRIEGESVASARLVKVDPRLRAELVNNNDPDGRTIRIEMAAGMFTGFAAIPVEITKSDGFSVTALVVVSCR